MTVNGAFQRTAYSCKRKAGFYSLLPKAALRPLMLLSALCLPIGAPNY